MFIGFLYFLPYNSLKEKKKLSCTLYKKKISAVVLSCLLNLYSNCNLWLLLFDYFHLRINQQHIFSLKMILSLKT